jgi:hypothetical protein
LGIAKREHPQPSLSFELVKGFINATGANNHPGAAVQAVTDCPADQGNRLTGTAKYG